MGVATVRTYRVEPVVRWAVTKTDTGGETEISSVHHNIDIANQFMGDSVDGDFDGSIDLVVVDDRAIMDDHLVMRFAEALREKMRVSREKGRTGWEDPNWMDECRARMREHLEKGDPRDVALFAAFLWHHGETTANELGF